MNIAESVFCRRNVYKMISIELRHKRLLRGEKPAKMEGENAV